MGLRVNPAPLSRQIREARVAADLSQVELAEHLGVSSRTVQYWESGKTPQPKHRRRLRDFLAVNGRKAA